VNPELFSTINKLRLQINKWVVKMKKLNYVTLMLIFLAVTGIGFGQANSPKVKPSPTPPPPKVVSLGLMNNRAISKPQPAYPAIARAARVSGTVTVRIVINEEGRVISASAVSGPTLLRQAAVAAANQARFSPTILDGRPVRGSGVITYIFKL
jgi:protein TonB